MTRHTRDLGVSLFDQGDHPCELFSYSCFLKSSALFLALILPSLEALLLNVFHLSSGAINYIDISIDVTRLMFTRPSFHRRFLSFFPDCHGN